MLPPLSVRCIAIVLLGATGWAASAGCASSDQSTQPQPSRLEQAKAYSAKKAGDALLVWKGGDLVLEAYQNGYDPEQPHILTEVSALFPALTALTLVDNSLLALDEPVARVVEGWRSSPQKSKVTLSHLLHRTSGLKQYGVGQGTVPAYEKALTAPIVEGPGEKFRFGYADAQALGAVLERTDGKRPMMKERLFLPLGIPGGRWLWVSQNSESETSAGSPQARSLSVRLYDGAHLTARHLGRVGRMLLQDGQWKGKTIIENLAPLTEPTPASPGYGAGVWLNVPLDSIPSAQFERFWSQVPESILLTHDEKRLIYDGAPPQMYMAAGRYNQRLYVLSSKEMVIVRLGRADRTWSDAEFLTRLLGGKSL
ncbi:serine hydrolase domain-containing protein [Salinibacter altiplanensis]|uniref:serine hydrolase domain-containing protein n=1 Tax=Salinibacter altiplanensis TaxID=1803181 RepID=UPI000C9FFB7D|nr:serine hydrolase [Salinibacter altiplanensis]